MKLGTAVLVAINQEIGRQRALGHRVLDADLARVLGTSKNTVGRRLAGQGKLTVDELEALAAALGLSADELWTRARRVQAEAPPADDLEAGLSPADRAAVEQGRAEHGVPPKDGPPRSRRHSA